MQRSLEAKARGARRRATEDSLIPLFSYGFRPFFLGAGIWAVIVMALWVGSLAGLWRLGDGYGALAWHAHEMLFGYSVAVVARVSPHRRAQLDWALPGYGLAPPPPVSPLVRRSGRVPSDWIDWTSPGCLDR